MVLAVTALKLVSANGICRPDSVLSGHASADTYTYRPFPKRCEDGPARVIHTVKGQFFWPPIYRGTCDKLFCKDPPCIARKFIWRSRCVLVYKLIHGYWKKIGFRTVRYIDHLKCGCKECSDIKDAKTCINTKPCPNTKSKLSFCYYDFKKRDCDCCIPYPCPPGQWFNKRTCSCDCPKGSRKVGRRCIGDCDKVAPLSKCKFVYCEDNPLLNCYINKKNKCDCPSCDRQKSASLCPKTRCLELRNKPYCVYDKYDRECRCPECKDQRTKKDCWNFFCNDYRTRCRFNDYTYKCFCPSH